MPYVTRVHSLIGKCYMRTVSWCHGYRRHYAFNKNCVPHIGTSTFVKATKLSLVKGMTWKINSITKRTSANWMERKWKQNLRRILFNRAMQLNILLCSGRVYKQHIVCAPSIGHIIIIKFKDMVDIPNFFSCPRRWCCFCCCFPVQLLQHETRFKEPDAKRVFSFSFTAIIGRTRTAHNKHSRIAFDDVRGGWIERIGCKDRKFRKQNMNHFLTAALKTAHMFGKCLLLSF